MKKLVFATNNLNKLKEIRSVIFHFKIEGLKDISINEDIPETGNTLKANALQKAKYIFNKTGLDCFADDTGLEIEALHGEPGVYSARYAGEKCSADDNMEKVLKELSGLQNRDATFKTVIALIINGQEYFFEGKVKGCILLEKTGEDGFGYDPIFQPLGFEKSFAEMTMVEKNLISHRGLAVKQLIQFLKE